jgi:CRISPR system Cascade subunit CasC
MLVELHLLTSHAPSNLNRDDFGRPKTALFGGTERGRISSQALKRAIRKSPYLAERLGDKLSTRSLHIPLMIYNDLKEDYAGDDAKMERLGIACEAVGNGLGKVEEADGDDNGFKLKNKQIVFLTQGEIERLTAFVREVVESDQKLTKKAATELGKEVGKRTGISERPSDGVDMALFGRMTTDDANAFAAVDASMQVAHPIATHTTVTETDYFTAVDDWKTDASERGSGHIGELDFNSAVYYKYLSCNLDALVENLGGETDPDGAKAAALDALEAVFDAACRVTPSGKQNSFASHSPADAALLVVRPQNVPCSLATAFERAVPASDQGYTTKSARAMLDRYVRIRRGYELDGDRAAFFTLLDEPETPDHVETVERIGGLWEKLRSYAA